MNENFLLITIIIFECSPWLMLKFDEDLMFYIIV